MAISGYKTNGMERNRQAEERQFIFFSGSRKDPGTERLDPPRLHVISIVT
jgi:hypothetical protein